MKSAAQQQIEGQWDQFKGRVKESWGNLTDDDLKRVSGKYDQLVGLIKEKTGQSRASIEKRLEEMASQGETVRKR